MIWQQKQYIGQDASETVVAEARDGGVHHASHGHVDPLASTAYGGDHGDAGIRGAIHNMDSQFLYLLSKITGKLQMWIESSNLLDIHSETHVQTYIQRHTFRDVDALRQRSETSVRSLTEGYFFWLIPRKIKI